ncbi:MAG: hypothetical protein GXN99_01505 [Candidatus Nanohaloarchaeota archaeon]|nr:hypothetical protein [Candidatus Nanohaloarchaeota archaeon]
MMKRKGLSTAIAVVVSIVVLLIIAIAIITMTTGNISDLGSRAGDVMESFKSQELTCNALVNKDVCNANDHCSWDENSNKCVPR